jgi:hypothetical protein
MNAWSCGLNGARWPQIVGIGRAWAPSICLASYSLSTDGIYRSVSAFRMTVRAWKDPRAASKSPPNLGWSPRSLCIHVHIWASRSLASHLRKKASQKMSMTCSVLFAANARRVLAMGNDKFCPLIGLPTIFG